MLLIPLSDGPFELVLKRSYATSKAVSKPVWESGFKTGLGKRS